MSAMPPALDAAVHQRVRVVGVSIPVPDPHGAFLQAKRASYGDPQAELVPAHVTLLGPTSLTGADLPQFVAHLHEAAAAVSPFTMVLRGAGTFRPVSSVVFVQVQQGIGPCRQLEAAIRRGPYHHEPAFSYSPHVTVAHDVDPVELDRASEELADYHAAFAVTQFWLYEQDSDGRWRAAVPFLLGSAGGR